MSRIDELIERLCPDGVEYKPFAEAIARERCKGRSCPEVTRVYSVSNEYGVVASDDFRDNQVASADTSNYTVIRPGMFAYNPSRIDIGSIGRLTDGAETGLVSPLYVVFSVVDTALDLRFVEYFIGSSYVRHCIAAKRETGARNRFDFSNWNAIKIPVPPMEVQEEIVRVLDSFAKLEAELEAELEARRRQYAHYRDGLLDFAGRDDVRWMKLGEIAINRDSQRKPIKASNRVAGDIPYYGASGIVDYVRDYIFDGDYLLVSEDGANLLARSTPIAFQITGKTWVNNHAHILEIPERTTRKLVEIYLNSISLEPYISAAAQPKLTKDKLSRIEVPVPSLEEQERIVAILDKFDALVNDISQGIPAEIEARRKQYEHYRDKLLSFKERVA